MPKISFSLILSLMGHPLWRGRHISFQGAPTLGVPNPLHGKINFLHVIQRGMVWNKRWLTSRRTPPLHRKIRMPSDGMWDKGVHEKLRVQNEMDSSIFNAQKDVASHLIWHVNFLLEKEFSFSSMPTYPKAPSDGTQNKEIVKHGKKIKRSMKEGLLFLNA